MLRLSNEIEENASPYGAGELASPKPQKNNGYEKRV